MAMALSDFQDEVRENIKRDTNGVSDARITRWLNWAKDYISDLHSYEEMHRIYDGTTTTDIKRYGFPTRMKDVFSLTLQDGANSRKLTYVAPRLMDKMIPRVETYSTGVPDWYVDYGVNFELYKIPNSAYVLSLRCTEYPADLSGATDVCALLRKDALITAVATTFGFFSLREVDDAAYWGSEIVPPLYEASLRSDHSAEDWEPSARGFGDGGSGSLSGEWWKSPFTGRSV
jgi:hypothetical protein